MKNEFLKKIARASFGFPSEVGHAPPNLIDAVGISGVTFCDTQKSIRAEASTFRLPTSKSSEIPENEIARGFSGYEKRDPVGCKSAIEEFNSLINLDANHSCGFK